jgi:transposase-like protein
MDSDDFSTPSTPSTPVARAKRRSRAEREQILTAFARSGQTPADFARDHEICLGTFHKWLYPRKAGSRKRGAQAGDTLAAVRLTGGIAVGHDVEVRLRSGLCLAIPMAAGATAIADLIHQLDRPC